MEVFVGLGAILLAFMALAVIGEERARGGSCPGERHETRGGGDKRGKLTLPKTTRSTRPCHEESEIRR